jgi:radical SAM protein with 4Fe4S-binding SPASM domain
MFKPKSFHFQWHITERCFLRCRHCYQNAKLIKEEVNFPGLVQILNKFINQVQIWQLPKKFVNISLTGGEPLIRNDFFDLLQKCYENRHLFSYGILTNGILLDPKKVNKFKDLNVSYVQISLEGLEETNDFIRGKGTFKKIIEAMKLLAKEKIIPNFSMTVSRANLSDVPKVIELANQLKVSVGIRRLVPVGRGKGIESLLLSPQETEEMFANVLKMKEKFWDKDKISFGCEDGILSQNPRYSSKSCSAGYCSFSILPNGDVYPCRRLGMYLGNLLTDDFSDIYYNSPKLLELRNMNNVNDKCQVCRYFTTCHGGAKCINYAYYGSPFLPDPGCWRLFDTLPSKNLKLKNEIQGDKEQLDLKWIVTRQ